MSLDSLQRRLGYTFRDPGLLSQALTHRSFGRPNNERLEFLGDSVLNCVVASILFESFEEVDEGDLSRLRANLVREQALHEIAVSLRLSDHLRLGEGELKSGGASRRSILADTLEAIFGAVLRDGGFDAAKTLIESLYVPVLASVDPASLGKDAKTLLQEHLQGRRLPLPVYTVLSTRGAAHDQTFEVECAIPKLGISVVDGGPSRKAAEQGAARQALERAQALPASASRKRADSTALHPATSAASGARGPTTKA
jgi:ribonuclease-3